MSLKKKLFEKIREYYEIVEEKDEIEENLSYTYSEIIEDDDLVDENGEYLGLCAQEMDLQDEISRLLLNFKEAPLDNLTSNEAGELDYFFRSSDLSFEQHIVEHLDFRLFILKEEIKKRYKEIRVITLTEKLNSHTRVFYKETIECYLYGLFDACCVLCRAITESIAKRYIENCGYENLLFGK